MSRLFVLVLGIAVSAGPALAASAVVVGAQTAVYVTDPTASAAVEGATARCAKVDQACRTLVSCDEQGFGAYATAMNGREIEAVGAVCGLANARSAQLRALEFCKQYRRKAACKVREVWQD